MPPTKVCPFVADFENWTKWRKDMKSVVRESGAAGSKGAKYRCKAHAMGHAFDSSMGIVGVQPGRKGSFECEWAGMIRPGGSCTVEPVPEGPRFTAHPTPEAKGFGKPMTPLMNVLIRRLNRDHLEQLRKALE